MAEEDGLWLWTQIYVSSSLIEPTISFQEFYSCYNLRMTYGEPATTDLL